MPPETTWKSMNYVTADCKQKGSFFISSIDDDSRFTVECERHGFCDIHPSLSPPEPSPSQKVTD